MDLRGTILNNRYKIQDKITEGGMSDIYIAHDINTSNTSVAVKILKTSSHELEDITKFRSIYDVISGINHPNIIKIYETGIFVNSYSFSQHYIVMEYLGGMTLNDFIARFEKFPLNQTIEILKQICNALLIIHELKLIHGDLKPGNILLTEKMKGDPSVKLIDFGLSRIKHFEKAASDDLIAGTFYYMPPEQSGQIHYKVDERSDLYSLGIIFYELLTGYKPFNSESLIGLLHEQITKIPASPSSLNKNIPVILDEMIMRLLEKDPVNRYQSAKGLLFDLEKYSSGNKNFNLGEMDKAKRPNFITPAIGREDELCQLDTLHKAALNSKGSICLISGEAGIGKTKLIEEFRMHVLASEGALVEGTSVERRTKTPWGLFRDTITSYVMIFQQYPAEKKKKISKILTKNCLDFSRVIIQLNPAIQQVFEESPQLIKMELEKEMHRFYNSINRFFYALAEAENGLVILFEDLQWCDKESLELLGKISSHISSYPLFITGTYRNDEITDKHELKKIIDASNEIDSINEIKINPFNKDQINEFITKIFNEKPEWTGYLSGFIFNRTHGSPLYSRELLMHLLSEKVMTIQDGSWLLDRNRLHMIDIPNTIMDVVLKRITLFEKDGIEILTNAAAIGKRFDIEILINLEKGNGNSSKRVIEVMDRAIENHVVEENVQSRGAIVFVHDRVRDALYERLNHNERRILHQKIASVIEKKHKANTEPVLFDLAYHYIEGGMNNKIIEYTHPAGVNAKNKFAYKEAIRYFDITKEILEHKLNISENNLLRSSWYDCTKELGEACLISGRYDEALTFLFQLLPYSHMKHDELEEAAIYKQICDAYYNKGSWGKSEEFGKAGLKLLGEILPGTKIAVIYGIAREALVFFLNRPYYNISTRKSKNIENERYKSIIRLYSSLAWSYYLSDPQKALYSILRMHRHAESKIGKSKELGASLTMLAGLFSSIPLFPKAMSYINKAYRIRGELDDKLGMAQTLQAKGYCFQWMGKYNESIEFFKQSINEFNRIGDINESLMSQGGLVDSYYYISDYNEMKNANDKYYDIAIDADDGYAIVTGLLNKAAYYQIIGDFNKAEHYGEKCLNNCHEKKLDNIRCYMKVKFAEIYLDNNEPLKALDFLENAKKIQEEKKYIKHYLNILYPLLAEAHIAIYQHNLTRNNQHEQIDLKQIKNSCKNALRKTKSWATIYGAALRINAKYYAIKGKNKNADKFFRKSINHDNKFGRRYELARTQFEYGIFLKETGNQKKARQQFESAYRLFNEIEIEHYKEKISSLLGIRNDKKDSLQLLIEKEKVDSILKLGDELKKCGDLKELSSMITLKAMEISGAQAGGIFIYNDESCILELIASKSVNDINDFEYSQNIIYEAFNNGRNVITTNAEDDENFSNFKSVARYGLKSIICIPLKNKDLINGVCYLFNSLAIGVFTDRDAHYLDILMSHATLAIENTILNEKLSESSKQGIDETGVLSDENVNKAMHYIKNHYSMDISRDSLAKELDITSDYLGKIFKSQTGKTIREYVNELRIKSALDMLLETDMKIIDIAYEIGFDSVRTFYRIFYRIMGDTASGYREKKRDNV